ncbi:hypothetical protein K493DRAFT_361115 [Basidiobolus meristosporus CBS 931.73]|uniref:G-protein coupled receptors family 2 profile 2 domain-containing protein n=1 Tax=Basidiobolus meristosporus CBS 931.73 TaxID=1314790 RepID=A0A1Y1XC64_9FUNG|nr:hypothetical protein K493DRAFT_361115 [Basidiobolus meristosporus CBS 931.73]|eukprot:ORX83312.1 hypothetical protein K493DRAFT_361115 [Basidiobolus meristosporus CBS 931.73]
MTFFNLANFLWGVCICLNVYLILLPPEKLVFLRRNLIYKFGFFSFGIPVILIIPLLARLSSIGTCWIKANDLRWGVFYGWLLFAFLMYIFLLSLILVHLFRMRNAAGRKVHHPYEKMPEVYQIIWKHGWSHVTPIQQFDSWSSAFTGLKGLELPQPPDDAR